MKVRIIKTVVIALSTLALIGCMTDDLKKEEISRPLTGAERFLLQECKKAKSARNVSIGGSIVNILAYAITGGSDGNQRSFDSNNTKVAHAQEFLSSNNCAQFD